MAVLEFISVKSPLRSKIDHPLSHSRNVPALCPHPLPGKILLILQGPAQMSSPFMKLFLAPWAKLIDLLYAFQVLSVSVANIALTTLS
jgi:hypothetical protein